MTLYAQSAVINEIGHVTAPPSQKSIDDQRSLFKREKTKGLLGLWFCRRWAKRFSNLLV